MSERELFIAALQIDDSVEREAYLNQACGDDSALRKRLDALLAAHEQSSSLDELADATSDHTPGGSPTVSIRQPALVEGPGTIIGPYKLLQKIGEGGMGAVFMAEQEKPVRRRVALKVIKAGMDTGQVVARFEAERQALAIMEHPNIARVLDVGATETGRPFFVMELVKGVPITEYSDRNQLTPKERLELFVPVCQAIQHAHQKGIIHRDIKPSNVLVSLHDGIPVPKVIDFGVAKAIDQRLTERTMFTEFGQIIGTLEYMSPEQAEMGAMDIDTRSDIYSLGVLLYELLTGSTPLEREKLRKAAYAEILRRIREEEPAKPSTRLSESKDSLPSISAQRKMEPARLAKLVRGELDWIVMKSLDKDRTRRYETANGFAKDILRYLDGDPVEACPPSASYKLRKFARKHRMAIATIGAFTFLLFAATAISTGLAIWANNERVRALKAELAATEQKERAQDREQMAIDAVKRYGDVVRETPELKNNPTLAPLRAKLLSEPQQFFKNLRSRLLGDHETTPGSLARLAGASFALGELTDEIGGKQDALHAFEESLAIRERLAHLNPSVTQFHSDEAASRHRIGDIQSETGGKKEALASLKKVLAIRERLARENPSQTQFQSELAMCHYSIGNIQRDTGLPSDAMVSYEQARAIGERLVRENPLVIDFHRVLAKTHSIIGILLRDTGRPAEALASYEEARATWERLARENPSVTEFWRGLAITHGNKGILLRDMGRPEEAMESQMEGAAIRERLARENPSVTEFQSDLASSLDMIGLLHTRAGKHAEAFASTQQALVIRQRLARENPSFTFYQDLLAGTLGNIGLAQSNMGRPAEAMKAYEQALAISERRAREHPESPDLASRTGMALNNMAVINAQERRPDKARAKFLSAIEWHRKALAANPNHPGYREAQAKSLRGLIEVTKALGLNDESAQAERELAKLRNSDPQVVAFDARVAAVIQGKAMPKNDAERIRLALRAYQKALHSASARLFGEALANDPTLAEDRQAQHRYNAACAAALAASGRGKDDPPPDDAAKNKLRRQAAEWLRAELAAWAKVFETGPTEMKATIKPTLEHWKADADLAGIRDAKELTKLPEEERVAFKQLWHDVDQLLTKVTVRK